MKVLLALVLMGAQTGGSDFAKRSRSFFEKIIDFKIEENLLVVHNAVSSEAASAAVRSGREAFGVSRFRYNTAHSGGSYSGGSGKGSVTINFEGDGEAGNYDFQLVSPDSVESMTLHQESPGDLVVEYRAQKRSVIYTQTKGKCRLQIKAGADSLSVSKRSFAEVLQSNPLAVRKHLLLPLEEYFDKTPVAQFDSAPPGKVLIDLKDGSSVVGVLKAPDIKILTRYGALTIPRAELRQVVFPGAESPDLEGGDTKVSASADEVTVITRRFTPKGSLEASSFAVLTPYGELSLETKDILHMAFGPPAAEPPAESSPSGP